MNMKRGGKMSSMTYEQRMAELKIWFSKEIATRFTMPTGIDPKLSITDTLEAVNNNLPLNITQAQMHHLVASIAKEVVQSARTRTLPQPKDFIVAAANASRSYRAEPTGAITTFDDSGQLRRIERLIRDRKAVPESWLKGERRKELLAETSVTLSDLAAYDKTMAEWITEEEDFLNESGPIQEEW